MNKIDATLPELLNMLVTIEGTLKSSRDIVLAVQRTSSKRKSSFKKKKKPQRSRRMRPSPRNKFQRRPTTKKNIFIATSKVIGEGTIRPTGDCQEQEEGWAF